MWLIRRAENPVMASSPQQSRMLRQSSRGKKEREPFSALDEGPDAIQTLIIVVPISNLRVQRTHDEGERGPL
jgi:hypothetical protein